MVQYPDDTKITDNDKQSIETHGKVASLLGRSLTEEKNDSQVEMAFMPMQESLKNLSSFSPEEAIEGLKKYMMHLHKSARLRREPADARALFRNPAAL